MLMGKMIHDCSLLESRCSDLCRSKAQLHKLVGCVAGVQLSFIFHNVSFIAANLAWPSQTALFLYFSLFFCSEHQDVLWPLEAF